MHSSIYSINQKYHDHNDNYYNKASKKNNSTSTTLLPTSTTNYNATTTNVFPMCHNQKSLMSIYLLWSFNFMQWMRRHLSSEYLFMFQIYFTQGSWNLIHFFSLRIVNITHMEIDVNIVNQDMWAMQHAALNSTACQPCHIIIRM